MLGERGVGHPRRAFSLGPAAGNKNEEAARYAGVPTDKVIVAAQAVREGSRRNPCVG